MVKHWWKAAPLALMLSCSGGVTPRTELLLVADTDIPGVQSIDFVVTRVDDGEKKTRTGAVTGASSLPKTLAMEHTTGPLGPFKVQAIAKPAHGNPLLSREHEVSFVPGKTLIVRLDLAARCIHNTECGDLVCTPDRCLPYELTESDLAPYTSAPKRVFDGTAMDGGNLGDGDSSVPDMDGSGGDAGGHRGGDGDAAGGLDSSTPKDASSTHDGSLPDANMSMVDAGQDAGHDAGHPLGPTQCGDAGVVNTLIDPNHCGGCFKPCGAVPGDALHVVGMMCNQGTCAYECETGWYDCNGDMVGGCTDDLTTNAYCGSCSKTCNGKNQCTNVSGTYKCTTRP